MESDLPGGYISSTAPTALPGNELHRWASGYARLHVDLGTGDGAFAIRLARTTANLGVIGIDTCLDHLHGSHRRLPPNVRFIQANALDWPVEDIPRMHVVTINFPYGSLLRELVIPERRLLSRLTRRLKAGGRIEIRINARAVADTLPGVTIDQARTAITDSLWGMERLRVTAREIDQVHLRSYPSSWSKRLGYGRPTMAILVIGRHRE